MRDFFSRGKPVKTAVELAVYYVILYFPDRYLLAPSINKGIYRSSYSLPGLLVLMALAVLFVSLLLLAPFFAGRMNRDSWAAWGCLSFLVNLAAYAAASLVVSLATGRAFIHTGLSLKPYGFYDILPLLHIVLLFCVASFLGSRCARAATRNRAIRRSRKLALG